METYIIYIGKAAIAAGAFYIAFLLLFQNQKHFTFNRIYLPVSLALSFVIPLITFTTVKYIEPANFEVNSFAYLAPASGEIVQPAFVFEWYHYLFGLNLLGTAGFLFHLLLGHLKAINIIQKSRIQKIFNNLVNITPKDIHPFSFFSKIVVSEKTLSHPDLEMIVCHENIHVREKHTLDILFTETMFLLQWFNPFAWLLKDAVKNNLEYLTDHEIAKQFNPQTYQLAMVTLADKQGIAPFLTALNGSQLKNRIVMMKKKTENKYAFVKQLIVLPLLAVLVMGLSNREVKTEVIQKENQLESNQLKNDSLKMNNKEFMSQIYHDGLFELQDYGEGAPLIYLNGKEVIEKVIFDESDFKTSQILPPKEALERFGERGKNGAMIFETKTNYLQKEAIKGKVKNEKDEPLLGVSVVDKGKLTGTITDTKGNYEIRSEGEIETLLFGKDGYEMMEVKTNGRKNIDVKLEVDNKLYIVDGKEYEGKTDEIDADNIERIDVLKGESGFKLYGDKGKNGVVLIMTKNSVKIEPAKVLGKKQVIGNINWINNEKYSSNELSNILGIKKGDEYSKEIIEERMYGKVSDLYMDNGYLFFNITITEKQNNDNTIDLELTLFEGTPWKIGKIEIIGNKTVSTEEYLNKIEIKSGDLFSRSKLNQSVRTLNELIKQNDKGDEVVVMPLSENLVNEFNTVNLVFKIKEKNEEILNTTKNEETIKPANVAGNALIMVDGKEYKSFEEANLSPDEIASMSVLKGEDAIHSYGGQAKDGVVLINTKTKYNSDIKINSGSINPAIWGLRYKISSTIKYPVEAQENNQQGVVEIWAYIQKDRTISRITDKKPDGKFINVDEVVVTALKSEKTVTSEKSKNLDLLVKESKRVIGQLSPLKIPELAGETVSFRIKFVLQ